MGLHRRDFLKTLGVVGATLAVGKNFGATPNSKTGTETEFYGMLYDPIACLGCNKCEINCAEAHGLPVPAKAPEAGIIRNTTEKQRTVVNTYKTSKGEVFLKKQCMHCNEPACAAACLTQAMHKTKEGAVIWRSGKCMGCRYCMVSCPYDIPKFEYNSPNPKIEKCDLCYERTLEGKMPVCAEKCPGDALLFGPRRELIAEARKRIAENPKDYSDVIYGEHDAGGTGYLILSPVPMDELGFNPKIQKESYPALSKGFLYSVPSVFVLLPPLLLGIHEATKTNKHKEGEDNE